MKEEKLLRELSELNEEAIVEYENQNEDEDVNNEDNK